MCGRGFTLQIRRVSLGLGFRVLRGLGDKSLDLPGLREEDLQSRIGGLVSLAAKQQPVVAYSCKESRVYP